MALLPDPVQDAGVCREGGAPKGGTLSHLFTGTSSTKSWMLLRSSSLAMQLRSVFWFFRFSRPDPCTRPGPPLDPPPSNLERFAGFRLEGGGCGYMYVYIYLQI